MFQPVACCCIVYGIRPTWNRRQSTCKPDCVVFIVLDVASRAKCPREKLNFSPRFS